jgi:hypothetical protein
MFCKCLGIIYSKCGDHRDDHLADGMVSLRLKSEYLVSYVSEHFHELRITIMSAKPLGTEGLHMPFQREAAIPEMLADLVIIILVAV